MSPGRSTGNGTRIDTTPCLKRQDAAVDHRGLEARASRYEGERTDMKPNFIYLTFAAALAMGTGVLGGAQDASSSEKKNSQVAATPSHGEEAAEEENGPGAAAEEEEKE